GYSFVDFISPVAVAGAFKLNGARISNSSRPFQLSWASSGAFVSKQVCSRGSEYSILVGDLRPKVNEYCLASLFWSRFTSFKNAKMMTEPVTGNLHGYGFVRLSDESDQQHALVEIQGVHCGNRPMRLSTVMSKNKNKKQFRTSTGAPPAQGYYEAPQPMNRFIDPNNTTVFVGGLANYVTEDELRSFFQGVGKITYVKIPPGKGCDYVRFVWRHAAKMTIYQMQGRPIGNPLVRLSWGRSQSNSDAAGAPYRPAP
ncbi:hypothetical protein F5882DRAFT_265627, partial [Hyaloscypha sp. PMI_1271]